MVEPVNRGDSIDKTRARPVDLSLLRMRLPISGIVSIVHRITGVFLLLCIPVLIYTLQRSLSGADEFHQLAAMAASPPGRVFTIILLLVFMQHFFSGIRHLLLDLHIGMARQQSRRSAWATFIATFLVALAIGIGVLL